MTEAEQAQKIANAWLDFQMNPLTQMVRGDPDCDACVLARQYIRAIETIEAMKCMKPTEDQWRAALLLLYEAQNEIDTWNSLASGSYWYGNEVADRIGEFLKQVDTK